MDRRRTDGDETWHRLREWLKGPKAAERLAGHILASEGFESIDPSHPLGGPDGMKDLVCLKAGLKWIAAVYFPRGQQSFVKTRAKFLSDLEGVERNGADALVFVTNQELSLSERRDLMLATEGRKIVIYHLERLTHILNNPVNYGVRLEFLGIGMAPEEQLAYFAERDRDFFAATEMLVELTERLSEMEDRFEGRTNEEIGETISELFDKVWYNRHMVLRYKVKRKQEAVDPEIWRQALAAAESIEQKYGKETLGPWDDFEWGMINGKLSALRWVLGDEWDMLDT